MKYGRITAPMLLGLMCAWLLWAVLVAHGSNGTTAQWHLQASQPHMATVTATQAPSSSTPLANAIRIEIEHIVTATAGKNAAAITIDLQVRDSASNSLRGLTIGDLDIKQNTQPITDAWFRHLDKPIGIVLAIDTVVPRSNVTELKSILIHWVSAALRQEDEVAIVTIGRNSAGIVSWPTKDHGQITKTLEKLEFETYTGSIPPAAITEGWAQTLSLAKRFTARAGRLSVLLISDRGGYPDNKDSGANVNAANTVNAGLPIYALVYYKIADASLLKDSVINSGGQYYEDIGLSNVLTYAQRLTNRLREGFVLGYTSNVTPGDSIVISVRPKADPSAPGDTISTVIPCRPFDLAVAPLDSYLASATSISITAKTECAIKQIEYPLNGSIVTVPSPSKFTTHLLNPSKFSAPISDTEIITLSFRAIDIEGNIGTTTLPVTLLASNDISITQSSYEINNAELVTLSVLSRVKLDPTLTLVTTDSNSNMTASLGLSAMLTNPQPDQYKYLYQTVISGSRLSEKLNLWSVMGEDIYARPIQANNALSIYVIARSDIFLARLLRWAIAILAILLLAALLWMCVAYLRWRNAAKRVYPIRISNLGNYPARFELLVKPRMPNDTFKINVSTPRNILPRTPLLTPEINIGPDAALNLALLIQPKQPYQLSRCEFDLHSRLFDRQYKDKPAHDMTGDQYKSEWAINTYSVEMPANETQRSALRHVLSQIAPIPIGMLIGIGLLSFYLWYSGLFRL